MCVLALYRAPKALMNVFHVARKSAFQGIGSHAVPPFGLAATIPSARGSHAGETFPAMTRRNTGLLPEAASASSTVVQLYVPAVGSSLFHGNTHERPAQGDDSSAVAWLMINVGEPAVMYA